MLLFTLLLTPIAMCSPTCTPLADHCPCRNSTPQCNTTAPTDCVAGLRDDDCCCCQVCAKVEGDPCTTHHNCTGDLRCRDSLCQCPPFEHYSDNACKPGIRLNGNCSALSNNICNGNCTVPNNTRCAGSLQCIDNICKCPTSDFNVENECRTRINDSDTCSIPGSCVGSLQCLDSTCKCQASEYNVDNDCKTRLKFDSRCTDPNSCAQHLECLDSTCQCPGRRWNNGINCQPRDEPVIWIVLLTGPVTVIIACYASCYFYYVRECSFTTRVARNRTVSYHIAPSRKPTYTLSNLSLDSQMDSDESQASVETIVEVDGAMDDSEDDDTDELDIVIEGDTTKDTPPTQTSPPIQTSEDDVNST